MSHARIERRVLVEQRSADEMQVTQNALQVMTPLAIGMNRLQHVLRNPGGRAHGYQRASKGPAPSTSARIPALRRSPQGRRSASLS
ncbi:hypothetical protein Bxe_B1862 [Paraburkholderia xenovorans LB400]|uniref:Uncharacterized protein n=1 Tax=Paraburkholderia xenovorans (strain LB400) TaxID=266265 RepID=Q13P83_PARXL|nr:hypothetical protein Bxe_B1862 [Paraburkholderia xenovorans LB400]